MPDNYLEKIMAGHIKHDLHSELRELRQKFSAIENRMATPAKSPNLQSYLLTLQDL